MMDQMQVVDEVAKYISAAQRELNLLLDSREKSLARTKLDEARMWLERLRDKYEE